MAFVLILKMRETTTYDDFSQKSPPIVAVADLFIYETLKPLIERLLGSNRRSLNKTGTSQVGAISKAQIKSKGPLETKKFEKKSHSAKKRKGGPFTLVRFCKLRLKSKKPKKDSLETKKFPKKSRTVAKKSKGGTL